MAEFEDILQRIITAEEDRTALLNVAQKYPALKSAVMAQDDYSRHMNENKTKLDRLGEWETWKEKAWDEQANTTKAEVMVRSQLSAAEQRLRELEATGGGDVNFEEVMAELGNRGYMTTAEFEAKVKPTLLDRKTYNDDVVARLNQQGAIFEGIFVETLPLVQEHIRDFNGEILQPKQLLQYMVDNKLQTPRQAYEKMYEPRLNELRAKRDLERETKIRQEEREKTLQEQALANNGRGNPVDNAGGNRQYGHLEAKKMAAAKAGEEAPGMAQAELGANTIASMAAEEYRKNPSAFAAKT